MRGEIREMLRLAWPVVLAEIAWVLMGIVDTIAVGPLGPAAIGAVGTGSAMFFALMVLGMGVFFALDTFVAQSFGAGRIDECHRWLVAGLWLAVVASVVFVPVGLAGTWLLRYSGINADVLAILQPYLSRLVWSAPPLFVYVVFRRYLQAMNVVRPVMVGIVLANVVNAVGNWALIYGYFGLPAFGVLGSAYATVAARVVLALFLWMVVVRRERASPSGFHDVSWWWDGARMWQIVKLGAPAAAQVTLEVGVFAVASALAGRISPVALAANQIALNVASFFFMIPYGLSSAAAVRVGQAVGRGDESGMQRAGWSALTLALVSALVVATLFLTVPEFFVRIFTADAAVVGVGATVLIVCAVFQPFDGFQVVATGALRGLGDTRTPMLLNLTFHWLVGLPVAYYLCFSRGWGIVGLWTGLSLGLIVIGVLLVGVWTWRSRHPPAMANAG